MTDNNDDQTEILLNDTNDDAAVIDPSSLSGDIEILKEVVGDDEQVAGYYERFKTFLMANKKEMKPWGQFANVARARKPANMSETMSRINHNIVEFKANYIFVMLILVLYCVLTSPLLLIGLGFLAVTCNLIMNERKDRVLMGQTLTKEKQLQLAVGITIPLLWFSAAGGTVFWIVGVSLCTVLGHASFMPIPGGDNPMHDIV